MRIIIEDEKKKNLTLGNLKAGDPCIIKHPNGDKDTIAIVTDAKPRGCEYVTIVDIESGMMTNYKADAPVTYLDNAEFHPYGAGR